MIGIKLHKWLFSLTLIISLVSFSGIVHEQVKPVHTITEVVMHKDGPTATYYVNFVKQNIAPKSTTYFGFNFKAFIKTQNSLFTQKEKAQSLVVFSFNDIFNTTYLIHTSTTKTEDALPSIG